MAIAVKVRELLDARGMTQVELRARTGLGYSSINAMYHNKTVRVDFATLDRLCEALGCEVGDLLEYVGAPGRGESFGVRGGRARRVSRGRR